MLMLVTGKLLAFDSVEIPMCRFEQLVDDEPLHLRIVQAVVDRVKSMGDWDEYEEWWAQRLLPVLVGSKERVSII